MKKVSVLLIIIAIIISFTVGIYADEQEDIELKDKIKIVDKKILEKLELMNIGQLRAIIIEYSYCVHYEDYLKTTDLPIKWVDKISCLNHLGNFVDGIK